MPIKFDKQYLNVYWIQSTEEKLYDTSSFTFVDGNEKWKLKSHDQVHAKSDF